MSITGKISQDTAAVTLDDAVLPIVQGGSNLKANIDLFDARFQASDADLAALAALAKDDGNIIVGDGATWVAESGATARASLGVTIGQHVQAYSANLTTLAAVTPGAAGLAILADATTEDVTSYLAVPTIAISLSSLKALDTTKVTRAIYNGSIWVWTTGDLSAAVTADLTASAIYAKADAIATTSGAWVRQYEALQVSWFGAAGDGATNDNSAFAAITTLVTYLGGAHVHCTPGANYLIDTWIFSSTPNLKLFTNGAEFTDAGTAGNSTLFWLGDNCEIDHLEYTLPTAKLRQIVCFLGGTGAAVHSWNITSVDQIANIGATSRAAMVMAGARQHLGNGTVTNFDNAYRYNCTDSYIGKTKCVSFLRGHWFNAPERCYFSSLVARTTSPNALADAGENGALFTSALHCHIDEIDIEDSGEHGVRFGEGSDDISVGVIRVHNPNNGSNMVNPHGGCGLKIRSDTVTRNTNITIGAVIVSDCGRDTLYFKNREGVLIERADNVYIGFARVFKVDQTNSCYTGIVVTNSTKVRVANADISDTFSHGVDIQNSDDDGATTSGQTDINITADMNAIGGDAYKLTNTAVTMRNINAHVIARSVTGAGFNIVDDGTGTVGDPCVFRGNFKDIAGTDITGTGVDTNPSAFRLFELFIDGIWTLYTPTTNTTGALLDLRSNVGGAYTRVAAILRNGKLDINGPIEFRPGASQTPTANSDVVFELTSNTTFTIKAKGSDGTVRSGTVTLA